MCLDMNQNTPRGSYLDFIKHKTVSQSLFTHQFYVTNIICHKKIIELNTLYQGKTELSTLYTKQRRT